MKIEHSKVTIDGKEYYQTIHINKFNTGRYYLNGKFHRENGPAVEREDGTSMWYLNGKLHREDGPAA